MGFSLWSNETLPNFRKILVEKKIIKGGQKFKLCSWYSVLVLRSCNYDCDLLKSLLLRNFAATATLKILLLELLHRRWFVLDRQDTELGNRHNILSHNIRLLWTFLSFCRGSRQGAFNRHRVIEKKLVYFVSLRFKEHYMHRFLFWKTFGFEPFNS